MELTNFDTTTASNEGEWMTLKHPGTLEPLDGRIRLAGIDSDQWKEAETRYLDKRRRKVMAGDTDIESQELLEARLRCLAACTLDWENITEKGKPVSCSESNAVVIYRKYRWIREQVDQFIGNRNNYLSSPESYLAEVEKKPESGESGDSGSSLAA